MNKKLKRLASVGLVLYALNKCLIPWGDCVDVRVAEKSIKNERIQIAMQTEKYIHNYSYENEQDAALHYLKLAHSITDKYLDYELTAFKSLDSVLDKKSGDCKHFSMLTHSNYLFLINSSGHPELSNYVRQAYGSRDGCGHRWLEIKQGYSFVPYETTVDVSEWFKIIPESIDDLVQDKKVLQDASLYNRTVTYQLDDCGNVDRDIHFFGIIKEPGLLLKLIPRLKASFQ